MATRRCLSVLARHGLSLISSNSQSVQPLTRFSRFNFLLLQRLSLDPEDSRFGQPFLSSRSFSSRTRNPRDPPVVYEDGDGQGEGVASEEDEEEGEVGGNKESEDGGNVSSFVAGRAYSVEEKIQEAAEVGYKVVGLLQPSDRVFKPYEPVFAVVQIGSHQFKVSNGDVIYTERLKYCDVNDKLILNKVLLLGSQNLTIIGRPILPDAAVHAVVEEHALDAKVIIFKKKRRKNYRRTKGHRQELTRLRITDIQGIEKPEMPSVGKKVKMVSSKKTENLAVAT